MSKHTTIPPFFYHTIKIYCALLASGLTFQSVQAADYIFNGNGGPYNLNSGDTLTIKSGSFYQGLSLPKNATIQVESGAGFKPSYLNNAQGTLYVSSGAVVEIPSVALMGGMVIDSRGDVTFKSNVNMNGAVQIINRAQVTGLPAPKMHFDSGYQLSNGSVIENQGLMSFKQDFNTQNGTKVTNSGTMMAEAFNPGGEFINNGFLKTSKFININASSTITNNCTFVASKGFNNNSDSTTNNGIIITTDPSAQIQFNGNFYQSAAGYIQGGGTGSKGFINNKNVTGGGKYYFVGETRNNGTFGFDYDDKTINFFDTSLSDASKIFDHQNSAPFNTTKNAVTPISVDQAMANCTYDSISNTPDVLADYGDAPTSGISPNGSSSADYGESSHTLSDGIYLGTEQPDADDQNQADLKGLGDDENGSDDEDGIFIPVMNRGELVDLSVKVNGSGGYLQAWIDWNGDGSFSGVAEQVALDLQDTGDDDDINVGDGTINLSVTVPVDATLNPTFARFRWSTKNGLLAVGAAPDGEVEDYMLTITEKEIVGACGIDDLGSSQYSSASPSVSSRLLGKDTLIFEASFDTSDWSGNILAYNLKTDNGEGGVKSAIWNSDSTIQADDRSLFTYNPEKTTLRGIALDWDSLNDQQRNWFSRTDGSQMGRARVAWLQGTTDNPISDNSLRQRDNLLGDIVNSSLTLQDPLTNFGYKALPGVEGSAYSAFLASKLTRTPSLLFGTNDGMFHALNPENGKGLFAYVPNEVIKHIADISHPKYGCDAPDCLQHRYTVDGGSVVADAYFDNAWQSVVVGGLGLGGRGLFALNITDPSNFSESDILWEISSTQAPDSAGVFSQHLGHTIPFASIVKLKSGEWVAVVGNGYDSKNKQAVLFLIDIKSGKLLKSFNTLIGTDAAPNGLSTPTVVDSDGDSIADRIYAGDLHGNLWSIDISSTNQADWGFTYGSDASPEPFFKACEDDSCSTQQAITAAPEVGRHKDSGLMIYVGTGKYFEVLDGYTAPSTVESFYGLQDNGVAISRSQLVRQEILAEVTVSEGLVSRISSNNNVDYASKKGWFLDLLAPQATETDGERVTSKAILREDRIIFVTLEPSVGVCDWGGESWLMEINAMDGARPSAITFDTNNDMQFNSDDKSNYEGSPTTVSGLQKGSLGLIRNSPIILEHTNYSEGKYVSGSHEGISMFRESSTRHSGRMSWTNISN